MFLKPIKSMTEIIQSMLVIYKERMNKNVCECLWEGKFTSSVSVAVLDFFNLKISDSKPGFSNFRFESRFRGKTLTIC